MLPLYLSIEGLYSYQQKQEIDFSQLTEAGLFGIFGKVGSGKSSIIEAISFALYGETERLNKQEKRTYNMLNLKSEAASIIFEFLNFERRKFRFVAQWKRRKKFEETTSLERYAYEWINNSWIPLESNDATAITHLTYTNFRRTIIIPQGQFKEFLELRGKDRSEMMKEIFNLDRFDLGPKLSVIQKKNNSQLEQLKGALSGFESVSTEIIQAKQTELSTAQETLAQVKAEALLLEAEVNKLTEGKRIRAELLSKKKETDELLSEQPKVNQLEQELKNYEQTNLAFRELLNHAQLLNKEKEQLTFKIERLTTKKQEILSRLEEQERTWNGIADDYQHLDTFKAENEDLKQLILIRKNTEQQLILRKRIIEGKPHLLRVQEEEKAIRQAIEEQEKKLDDLKQGKRDTSMLLALENWYQSDEHLTLNNTELDRQITQLQNELEKLKSTFEEKGLTTDQWEESLQESENKLNANLATLQQEETQWKVQAKLAEFADNLMPGQPCPLCGALEHPSPMVSHDPKAKEESFLHQQKEIRDSLQELKKQYQQLTRTTAQWKEKSAQLAQLESAQQQAHEKQVAHREQFQWGDFSATDKSSFLAFKDQNKLAEDQIRLAEISLKGSRTNLQAAQNNVDKYKTKLTELEQSLAILDSLIQQSEAQLRILKWPDVAHQSESQLETDKQRIEAKISFLEDSYKRLSESIQSLKTELARINGERNAAKEQFQTLYQQLSARQSEISSLLKEYGYDDIIQVQQILQKNIDIERTRKTIQEFNVNLQILLSQVADLEKRIAEDNYQEEAYTESVKLQALKKEELELQIGVTGALEKECNRLQSEFSKKEKLLEAYEKLNTRKSNLSVLDNLFRGSGFVNYVSSIHLQRLCKIANERFHRLTNNSLSLTINDNNEFEVIDYLNNGYKRSVKTLSGGQNFQASLCLALALAENVQALNKADKNFFFIDEGFGTQDADSINIVFETLQYLHRENRIVGIISHVEELKERIPRAITVINNTDKGSQLHYSYQ